MRQSYRFKVYGRVQGVFFRQSTREFALQNGIDGWVCNCDDATVEGQAQGAPAALEALRLWLHRGPARAQVVRVEWQATEQAQDGVGFEIRR